jgi:hypothetical protein
MVLTNVDAAPLKDLCRDCTIPHEPAVPAPRRTDRTHGPLRRDDPGQQRWGATMSRNRRRLRRPVRRAHVVVGRRGRSARSTVANGALDPVVENASWTGDAHPSRGTGRTDAAVAGAERPAAGIRTRTVQTVPPRGRRTRTASRACGATRGRRRGRGPRRRRGLTAGRALVGDDEATSSPRVCRLARVVQR